MVSMGSMPFVKTSSQRGSMPRVAHSAMLTRRPAWRGKTGFFGGGGRTADGRKSYDGDSQCWSLTTEPLADCMPKKCIMTEEGQKGRMSSAGEGLERAKAPLEE